VKHRQSVQQKAC